MVTFKSSFKNHLTSFLDLSADLHLSIRRCHEINLGWWMYKPISPKSRFNS